MLVTLLTYNGYVTIRLGHQSENLVLCILDQPNFRIDYWAIIVPSSDPFDTCLVQTFWIHLIPIGKFRNDTVAVLVLSMKKKQPIRPLFAVFGAVP